VDERDKAPDGSQLYVHLVTLLRDRRYAGATVLRGIMGYGAHATVHADTMMHLASNLPITVECVDTEERIAALLPELDALVGSGLVTTQSVRAIVYRRETGAP
jgi:PII-like signaling protein